MADPVRTHFDQLAPDYDRWKRKARYYYEHLKTTVLDVVPRGATGVCDVGCGTGDMLAAIAPGRGVGLDLSRSMVEVAMAKYPQFDYLVHDITHSPIEETFDFVITVDVLEHVHDLDAAFANLARMVNRQGLLVAITPNPNWAPVLYVAEKLRAKMPEGQHQWRTRERLVAAAHRTGLEVRGFDRSFVVPRDMPVLTALNDPARAAWLQQRIGLVQRIVLEKP